MSRHPSDGFKGAKPRLTSGKPLSAVNAEYLETRNRLAASKVKEHEMKMGKARGELILTSLVRDRARYLVVVFRQRILAAPTQWASKVTGLTDEHAIAEILRGEVRDLLTELRTLPLRITDENWLETLEAEEEEE